MRRREKEIKEISVIEEILREQEVGRLATCVENEPYVVPINFVYSNGNIFFHSHRDGLKISNIARNPRVCFEVDSYEKLESELPCNYSYKYHSVIVRGTAKFIEEPEKRLRALSRFTDKYALGKGRLLKSTDLEKNKDLVLFEIEVDEMTGKMSPVKPTS